jgi:hypothetical protein
VLGKLPRARASSEKVEQLDDAARVGGGGVGADEFSDGGAIHVGDVFEIDQQLPLAGFEQVFDQSARYRRQARGGPEAR